MHHGYSNGSINGSPHVQVVLLILEDINFRCGHVRISLSGSKATSNSCQESALCFFWNSFVHYLHRSKSYPFFEYRSLPSLPQLELIFHTSKAHNNCISDFKYNLQLSNLSCNCLGVQRLFLNEL